MNKKIEELYLNLPGEHKELAKLAYHLLEELSKLENTHRQEVAVNAMAGVKPNLEEEQTFKETIQAVKGIIIKELKKTAEDLEHLGDKNWDKHYKDGVL